jgi:peptide-methionine (R)-S-oxide reductase
MSNQRNPDDLKNNLTEMQFYVTQNHGTEPPFTGRLLHNKRDGVYHCLVCDAPCSTPRPSTILAAVGRAFTSR